MVEKIMKKMIDYSNSNLHDINHFIKVHSFSRNIGLLENVDSKTLFILEVSAIVHDIACPLCRIKYGKALGKYQEIEGEKLAREFLEEFNLDSIIVDRICFLVAHHHTLDNISGIDYQILIEADYLVNAYEEPYSLENIINFKNKIFKTKAGIELLDSIYLR